MNVDFVFAVTALSLVLGSLGLSVVIVALVVVTRDKDKLVEQALGKVDRLAANISQLNRGLLKSPRRDARENGRG